MTQAWLQAWQARESIRLIEEDRELFEHLVDVAQSSYSTAMGRTRQQDLVRAQLELTRLEDRLSVLYERLDTSRSKLGEWLRTNSPASTGGQAVWDTYAAPRLSQQLPDIRLQHPELYRDGSLAAPSEIAALLSGHPALLGIDSAIDASRVGVELARQKYRPEWKVNASYGYREDGPMGQARPDFFSVGLAFDLPFFTSRRQDQQLQAAIAGSEASFARD